ncbi:MULTISPECIES: TonB-dependent hemoglobin/transferrin/lactoferrin family receptor [Bradyrhizobium]|nr:TonB-dependent hemoglobin/transferrin/lactoferrin family receptor [Bradyrhizobium diazoefficiens]MBP1062561.1 hemoglobin/transferrin/lactoferrin receptor protein [Bradyrhizobium japonicum]QLD41327.1 TonB-dependent hemoglobin/transferrin/lactoferrin family receptor [Bradyrhizobium diazoefficiens]WLA75746.1 TonB-dependent hemoglobin/transferrin/lactoferrin family receptor [Bradyrhizobium diazoefficiens]WLB40171.1 TonB-dependent hemoglobin/transferrin/lactoferrin family receptor [Bradyrhizobium
MADGAKYSRALILGASVVSIAALATESGLAQTASPQAEHGSPERPKQAKRKPAKPLAAQQATPDALNARAQAGSAAPVQTLDTITVAATKTRERAIDALAPVSSISLDQIQGLQPNRLSDVFHSVPGVSFQERGDDPATVINIRGLQDFGRVAVVVDGARQNYQRTGHNANGSFFLDPELIGGVDVVRGPTANIYGSGAIGGLVSFRTKDINDVLRPGERWGVDLSGSYGSNNNRGLGSVFGGVRATPDVDIFGGAVYRTQGNYKDGNGTEIGNTGNQVEAGLMKLTVRPALGHEVKFGAVFQDYQYDIGQFNRGPTTTQALIALNRGSSVYASDAKNYSGTVTWNYSLPSDNLFDWHMSVYGNRTDNDQTKTYHYGTTPSAYCNGGFGNNVSGCVGDKRGYVLNTYGVDANNTTRFNVGDWRNALTWGVDAFQDDVITTDSRGNSNITTPSGIRTVSGGFLQLKQNYSTWLEAVSAIRYDRYDLDSGKTSTGGDRFSPKITLGVTPVPGFQPYVSYAEGYRAPSITETVISGAHATGGGPAFFVCPDGTAGLFCFLPNPNLRPEVGKNKEVGINLKYDNIFSANDSFRGKINLFRNDVSDYIDLVASAPVAVPPFGSFSQFYQYQNIANARIRGFEAETMYDAGDWFIGVAGHYIQGKNVATNIGLATITPRKVVTTGGVRLLDRTLILTAQWASYGPNNDVPAGYLPATGYELVNLYLTYNATRDIVLSASIDNLLNQYYRPYAIPGSSTDGTTQNDVLWSSPGPGRVYKAGMKIHFGGA